MAPKRYKRSLPATKCSAANLPTAELQHLMQKALPRIQWIGEKDEIADTKGVAGKEARARAEEGLAVYIRRMQHLSPMLWFREGDTPLGWKDAVKDPLAVILECAMLQGSPPDEIARRLVSVETVTVLLEEALQRSLRNSDTCAEVTQDRLIYTAQRFLSENLPREMCAWERLEMKFSECKEEALGLLSRTKSPEGKVYTSTGKRGIMDRRLLRFLSTRSQFFSPPSWAPPPSFTSEQATVYEAVLQHLSRNGWSVLSGPGGAGKTHMLRHVFQVSQTSCTESVPDGPDCPVCGEERMISKCAKCGRLREIEGTRAVRVCFLGPTNRSVAVLLASVRGSAEPRQEVAFGTVHSMSRRCDLPRQDLLIIDEASMLAAEHGDLLLKCEAFRYASWLLVGDHCQLPPVGAGEILRPLLTFSCLPSLKRNLRVTSEPLGHLIQSVREGRAEAALTKERKFSTSAQLMDGIRESMCDIVLCIRNEERIRYNAYCIQLHPCGIVRLCALDDYRKLTEEWHTGKAQPRTFIPFVGMPVRLQTNDHKPGACRGDLGCVVAVSQSDRVWHLDIKFGASVITIRTSYFLIPESIRPAFATTLHDAQGSQRKRVGIVLPPSRFCPLLSLETLYTAASRAQEDVIIFSCGDDLQSMLEVLSCTAPLRLTPLAFALATGNLSSTAQRNTYEQSEPSQHQ